MKIDENTGEISNAPFLRSNYNYDTNQAGDESGLKCEDKSLAQQHMKDECDINKLVERFVVRGEIPQLVMPPMQGDFTEAPTYQEALNLMVEARHSFMALEAKIRSRFDNDPAKFVDFCSNPENADDVRKMGLMSREAIAAFELKAQTQKDLDAANAADAAAYRASRKEAQS